MENTRQQTAAVILAAGQGKRMGSQIPKQFMELKGKPLIYYSLKAFEESGVDKIILVTGKEETGFCRQEIVEAYNFSKVWAIVPGGKERYHSVYNGLCALENQLPETGIVLIHDGARPLVTREIIKRTIEAAKKYKACAAAMPVKDTIKEADLEGFSARTPDRSLLWQVQTPQTFQYGLIKKAYDQMIKDPSRQQGITDDAMVIESITGQKVKLIEGSYQNIKVTTPEDLLAAAAFLQNPGLPG